MKSLSYKKTCPSMLPSPVWILIHAILLTLAGDLLYSREMLTISQCGKPPTIDGMIDATEWQDAAVFSGLVESDSVTTSAPNTVVYVMADEENIYVAARCPEPDSRGPQGFVREHDDRAFEDDSIQVYIAPDIPCV